MAETDKIPGEPAAPDSYALVAGDAKPVAAPVLDYAPPMPRDRSVPIGLIGAGGISFAHLDAYRKYGLNVVAIADRHLRSWPEPARADPAAVVAFRAVWGSSVTRARLCHDARRPRWRS
jgi:hypothetical protein